MVIVHVFGKQTNWLVKTVVKIFLSLDYEYSNILFAPYKGKQQTHLSGSLSRKGGLKQDTLEGASKLLLQ